MKLRVGNLSFSYRSRQILKDISFELKAGEITAILGPNGAGKTTLLRTINGILKPQGGSVLLDEMNLLKSSPRQIARKVSSVAQRSEPGRITAFDTVLLGRKPHLSWKISGTDLEETRKAIRLLELEDLSLRYVDEMSGGEYQKVCIARALAQNPAVMLLDEPTSFLDLRNQISILKNLRRIARDHHLCVLISMHDLNTAFRYADRFIFLKEGKIYATASGDEISPRVIREVYGIPVTIHRENGHPFMVPAED